MDHSSVSVCVKMRLLNVLNFNFGLHPKLQCFRLAPVCCLSCMQLLSAVCVCVRTPTAALISHRCWCDCVCTHCLHSAATLMWICGTCFWSLTHNVTHDTTLTCCVLAWRGFCVQGNPGDPGMRGPTVSIFRPARSRQRWSSQSVTSCVTCRRQGPLGPNGAPGPPGVKVSSASVWTSSPPSFLSHSWLVALCLKGIQGEPGVGVQVTSELLGFVSSHGGRKRFDGVGIFNPQGAPGAQGSTGLPGPPGPPGAMVGLLTLVYWLITEQKILHQKVIDDLKGRN